MNGPSDPRRIGAWVVGSVALIVYLLTLTPTVAFWDVGEFIACGFTLGIPHSPGAPTFILLGRLATLLPTPVSPAVEMNAISALASAATALLLYSIVLEMLDLWNDGLSGEKHLSPAIRSVAAAVAALGYAFGHSAWFNAVEAEVYALSMFVTALALWLALRHIRGGGDQSRASLLLGIGYLLGLGAGNHLLALLTIPTILILLWFFDRASLKRTGTWVWMLVLFAVGYSIYALIFVRSGLDPPIDMNNPETWHGFVQFLQRRQYGDESLLMSILPRSADFWSYQLDYHFLRYLRGEFLLPLTLLALFGAVVNLFRDHRTFLANGALWLVMGLGLVIYLNMPDPQPRDRFYIFAGCWFAMAIWMGMGMAGIAGYLQLVPALRRRVVPIVAALSLLLVGGQLALRWHSHDRSGNHIAHDYAYNILQSCPRDAILFTNGDNDTYPLWYLQVVEGLRQDVRVVNLSLLNTPWYIAELRDRDPRVPITLTDAELEELGVAMVGQDTTFTLAGLPWTVPGNVAIRPQDQLIAHIVAATDWQLPLCFAITVPAENQAWLVPHLQLRGFVFELVREGPRVNVEETFSHLVEVFRYRGIVDPRIYKDADSAELVHNYRVVYTELIQSLLEQGAATEAASIFAFGNEKVDLSAPDYVLLNAFTAQALGDTSLAREILTDAIAQGFELEYSRIQANTALIRSYADGGLRQEAERVLDDWLRRIAGMAPRPDARDLLAGDDLAAVIRNLPLHDEMIYAFVNLVYYFAERGEFDRAAWALERWLERAPSDEGAREWLEAIEAETIPDDLRRLALRYLPARNR